MSKDSVTVKINTISNAITCPPSRVCIICDTLEYEGAEIINHSTWLCTRCTRKLKSLLYPEHSEDQGIMRYHE